MTESASANWVITAWWVSSEVMLPPTLIFPVKKAICVLSFSGGDPDGGVVAVVDDDVGFGLVSHLDGRLAIGDGECVGDVTAIGHIRYAELHGQGHIGDRPTEPFMGGERPGGGRQILLG